MALYLLGCLGFVWAGQSGGAAAAVFGALSGSNCLVLGACFCLRFREWAQPSGFCGLALTASFCAVGASLAVEHWGSPEVGVHPIDVVVYMASMGKVGEGDRASGEIDRSATRTGCPLRREFHACQRGNGVLRS